MPSLYSLLWKSAMHYGDDLKLLSHGTGLGSKLFAAVASNANTKETKHFLLPLTIYFATTVELVVGNGNITLLSPEFDGPFVPMVFEGLCATSWSSFCLDTKTSKIAIRRSLCWKVWFVGRTFAKAPVMIRSVVHREKAPCCWLHRCPCNEWLGPNTGKEKSKIGL